MEKLSFPINRVQLPLKTKTVIQIIMILSIAIAIPLTINLILLKYNFHLKYNKEWLNVHLIPHTHDDVGWLKTPENYYNTDVRVIINNVVYELQQNSLRRFVYVESYYFWKWWLEQSEFTKEVVRNLIKSKQLEIIGGGFCMSDEAVTHYQSFIDQSTWGLRFLNDTFGPNVCPTVAWQIDTFGHSKGIASLLAQMGFTSLFISRLDVEELKYRHVNKLMEFLWLGNENLGETSSIFTSVLYKHYSAPHGFDFESVPAKDPVNFSAFALYARRHAKIYKTNNILVPMGDDFRYVNAKKYFKKMDELIRYFNKNPSYRLKIFYSTPSTYIKSLQNSNLLWPIKFGDFFPYAAEMRAYWTGFYTSRPSLKYFERISNNFLQISKQLLVLSHTGMLFFKELTSLREAVAILQHHDAITGTSQQHVTNHYSELLYKGIDSCAASVNVALGSLATRATNFPRPQYQSCLLLNISSCHITETCSQFVVTVYNSLSQFVNYYVRIPVTKQNYIVLTHDGKEVSSQIVVIPKAVRNIPGRSGAAKSELIFKASNLPPLGFKSFYVREKPTKRRTIKFQYKNDNYNIKPIFNISSQLLSGFRTNNLNISVCQRIKYYESRKYWSGAYLFGPEKFLPRAVGEKVTLKKLNHGNLIEEYEQVFSDWASQIIRIYQDEDYVELEWLIGPIPVEDCIGKEIVSTYTSDIENGNVYYTDINGMEMEKRIRNYRYWSEKTKPSVSGNFYPVTTMISIEDNDNQMFIIVDRPQGGASLHNGEIELMIHRRLLNDDGRGVEEPLNEKVNGKGLVVRGRHWLLFGKNNVQMRQRAKLFAQKQHSEPWLFFFDASSVSFEDWRSNYITEFSGLNNNIPRNIRILTLEPWREDTVLLRLEHIFEEDPISSPSNEPEKISLKDLFKNFDVVEVRETALGADRWLSDVKRLKWRLSGRLSSQKVIDYNEVFDDLIITLKPQQIRTFIVKIKEKNF